MTKVKVRGSLQKFDEGKIKRDEGGGFRMEHLVDGAKVGEDVAANARELSEKTHAHVFPAKVQKIRVVTHAPLLKEAPVCPLCGAGAEMCKCDKATLFKAFSDMVATSSASIAPATDQGAMNVPEAQKAY